MTGGPARALGPPTHPSPPPPIPLVAALSVGRAPSHELRAMSHEHYSPGMHQARWIILCNLPRSRKTIVFKTGSLKHGYGEGRNQEPQGRLSRLPQGSGPKKGSLAKESDVVGKSSRSKQGCQRNREIDKMLPTSVIIENRRRGKCL